MPTLEDLTDPDENTKFVKDKIESILEIAAARSESREKIDHQQGQDESSEFKNANFKFRERFPHVPQSEKLVSCGHVKCLDVFLLMPDTGDLLLCHLLERQVPSQGLDLLVRQPLCLLLISNGQRGQDPLALE